MTRIEIRCLILAMETTILERVKVIQNIKELMITEGRKTLIAVSIIIGISAAFLFLNRYYFLDPLETYSKNFKYEILSGIHLNQGEDAKEEMKKEVTLTAIGGNLQFRHILVGTCSVNKNTLALVYRRSGNSLQIKEIFKKPLISSLPLVKRLAYAITLPCALSISGTIYNLDKGDYSLEFIFVDKYSRSESVVKKLNFEVK